MKNNDNPLHPGEIGRQLGTDSTSATLEKVTTYCDLEVQQIDLRNQPKIMALKLEGSVLMKEEEELSLKLQDAPTTGSVQNRKWCAVYYWSVAVLLWVCGFFLLTYTLAPYRVGSIGIPYCVGAAVILPFLFDLALQNPARRKYLESIATIACIAGLASLMLLALIRGDLLVQELQSSGSVVIIDDPQSTNVTPPPQTDFYEKTGMLLMVALLLLAFAMDIGAGLALREARHTSEENQEDWTTLRARYAKIQERATALTYEIIGLENEGRSFAAAFWADFYKAMLTHTLRSAMTKFLVIGLVLLALFVPHQSYAATNLNEVIAVDLTQSVAVKDAAGKSEFEKNIDAVTQLLSKLPVSSRITVIGITDQSFTQPYMLLSATIPDDPGYFGERLQRARSDLVRTWKTRSAHLTPTFKHTDIIGALFLASELLHRDGGSAQRLLILFSDMQNSTRELNLESRTATKGGSLQPAGVPVANLSGIRVQVLGVYGARKSIEEWQALRTLWSNYFNNARAELQQYSILREGVSK